MSAKVGVGVFCFNPKGEFIIGKRIGSLGAGTYALPGGHLEFGEDFEHCAAREVREETGLKISEKNIRYLTCVNNVFPEGQHYVTIAMGCPVLANEYPKLLEPNKCEGWEWITWEDLVSMVENGQKGDEPRVLFQPLVEIVTQREGFHAFNAYIGQRSKTQQ